ncbi:MAG: ribosomal protein S9 [Berkelbacteria bacterium GW2011_GWA1_36_9]|uniref:Small ribosomal subunit protein uS9 n=1 Tax=Berkelbacteria bacterium GW2011_GWA1_36_9 TaxID=1618331 RepID=A0A0G0FWM1_9BACT|nr:MAG: ribosomal protein S9 [Berkelbacteria bacterium GW2011_GWA1_36_9]
MAESKKPKIKKEKVIVEKVEKVENPPVVEEKEVVKDKKGVLAIGRRKTAIARVKVIPGTGKFVINTQDIPNPNRIYTEPLKKANFDQKVDCFVKVSGGGLSAQLEAIRLGISRAIIKMDPELKKTLKVEGFLTRDPRMKERKKPGLKGARRAPQWAKR